MSGEFSANASALGYYYQARYALLLLLNADIESEISIERLDDIAFEKDSSAVQLLQTKHHITHTASLTDSSADLWNTLRVWSTAITEDSLDPTKVVLSLMTTGKAPDNSVASKL